jgi:pyruvate kinase
MLKDHKGINLPDSKVSASSLPPKDVADARFAIELGVDYLALSFVRTA